MPKIVATFLCSVMLLGIGCSSAERSSDQTNYQGQGTKVDYFIPQWTSVVKSASSTATFIANESVAVSSEVPGKIKKISFREGNYVREGEALAIIDSDIQVAEKEKIQLQIDLATKEWNRAQELLKIDAITKEEADRLYSNLQTLEADLHRLNVEIDKRTIKAPFSGVTGERIVSPGAYLTPGMKITSIYQLNPIKLEFKIPGSFQSLLKESDIVKFTTAAIKDTATAEIYLKNPRIDEETRSVQLRARAENPDHKYYPGGYAEVYYDLKASDSSALVPTDALIPILNGHKLLLIENGKVKSQEVEVGIRTENAVEITTGLKEKDTIIMSGLLILKENGIVVPDNQIKLSIQ